MKKIQNTSLTLQMHSHLFENLFLVVEHVEENKAKTGGQHQM